MPTDDNNENQNHSTPVEEAEITKSVLVFFEFNDLKHNKIKNSTQEELDLIRERGIEITQSERRRW